MNNDQKALLKFGICIAVVVVLLVAWFLTIGAPADEEEEEEEELVTEGLIDPILSSNDAVVMPTASYPMVQVGYSPGPSSV